jgi:hypothetical protein
LPNGPLTMDPKIFVTKITELDAYFGDAVVLEDGGELVITVVFESADEINDEVHVRDVVTDAVSAYCEDPKLGQIQFTR